MFRFERFRSFSVLSSTLVLVLLLSKIPAGIDLGFFQTKEVNFFWDVMSDEEVTSEASKQNIVTSASLFSFFEPDATVKVTSLTLSAPVAPAQGIVNSGSLRPFYQALKRAGNEQVRVAYFGDSALEGDNITADIRAIFQEKFGGEGVGFVAITGQDAQFRRTMKMTFSNDWDTYSITAKQTKTYQYGINGAVSIPKSGSSFANYETQWVYKSMRTYSHVRILYKANSATSVNYSFNGGASQSVSLPGGGVKDVKVAAPASPKSFRLTAPSAANAEYYGVSFESAKGVVIDNFPLRGNTGMGLKDINVNQFKSFNSMFGYDLVVLQFGMNILDENIRDYKKYENDLIAMINHVKAGFPNAGILVIGVGDRAQKRGTQLTTHENVPKVMQAQKNAANSTGAAFWSLFDAMGGTGSMVQWVNASPALATKDYTHLTLEGSKKVANLISEALISESTKF